MCRLVNDYRVWIDSVKDEEWICIGKSVRELRV